MVPFPINTHLRKQVFSFFLLQGCNNLCFNFPFDCLFSFQALWEKNSKRWEERKGTGFTPRLSGWFIAANSISRSPSMCLAPTNYTMIPWSACLFFLEQALQALFCVVSSEMLAAQVCFLWRGAPRFYGWDGVRLCLVWVNKFVIWVHDVALTPLRRQLFRLASFFFCNSRYKKSRAMDTRQFLFR